MYGKIFESMYSGTLYGQWQAIVTFQQLIVLCDKDGIIDMTPQAIAATTSIPIGIIEAGLQDLMKTDKYSRSPENNGRRIILIDEDRPWGWKIVNHSYYRNLANHEDKKQKDRERITNKRKIAKNINDVADCRTLSQDVADVAHTNTNTLSKNNMGTIVPIVGTDIPTCPHQEIVDLYHKILPELAQVRIWNSARQKLLRSRWKEEKDRQSLDWWKEFFEYVRQCPLLMGHSGNREWEATLEWLIKPKNFVKVIEGTYVPKAKSL